MAAIKEIKAMKHVTAIAEAHIQGRSTAKGKGKSIEIVDMFCAGQDNESKMKKDENNEEDEKDKEDEEDKEDKEDEENEDSTHHLF